MKGYPTSLVIRNHKLKPLWDITSHLYGYCQKAGNNKCRWGCGEMKALLCCCCVTNYRMQCRTASKNYKENNHMSNNSTSGNILKGNENTNSKNASAPSYSEQHYLQWTRHKNNISVHRQWTDKKAVYTYTIKYYPAIKKNKTTLRFARPLWHYFYVEFVKTHGKRDQTWEYQRWWWHPGSGGMRR